MTTGTWARGAATAYAVGGGVWFVVGVTQAVLWGVEAPPGSTAFFAVEVVFLVAQLLLLFGLFGLRWSGALGRGPLSTLVFGIALLGHLTFVAAEVHSLILGALSDLLAAAALLSGAGLTLTGIAVLTAKRWLGWTRWVPLLTGLYFWLVMFPFVLFADAPSAYAIAGWGLARLALGLAMRAEAAPARGVAGVHA